MALTSPLLRLFRSSPIRPLQKHIEKAHAAAMALVPFIEAVLEKDWLRAEQQQMYIAKLEDDADEIKKELRLQLPSGLFLPVARGDLLELLTMQDRIANKAEDIAGLIIGRHMEIPTAISDSYHDFLKRCVDTSEQARRAINELDELLETGFRGNEIKVIQEMIEKLDKIENDTDKQQIAIRHQLFQLEKELNPIDTIFLYKIIECTGDLADAAQTVGGRLEVLLAQ